MRNACIGLLALLIAGCASLPPGADYPKSTSAALADPQSTKLGQRFAGDAAAHPGQSGFRILSVGLDGFLARAQLIAAAERTLDLEYFIFRQDETGQLLTDALLHAADRGVRVRVLVDDGDTVDGDEQLATLAAHPNIEIRIFNPFVYRGHAKLPRDIEFLLSASRLDYRMHNKLMVVDNAVALIGGRNIGDQYFQIDPSSQFGDDDVFSAGPVVPALSKTFDTFWACALSIPVAALAGGARPDTALVAYRADLAEHRRTLRSDGVDYAGRIASGAPLSDILNGSMPLVWASAHLVYDSPEKKAVENGQMVGKLMHPAVAAVAKSVKSELLMVTPYFIPGNGGMRLLGDLRARGVRVGVLTNSLASSPEVEAQSGYIHYRTPLLEEGVELYEVRSLLGSARGSGESKAATQSGEYALHAKLFVFDRQQVYIGSMNFDERSHHLNTEIGLIIDSPELARQAAARFEAMVTPENSYRPMLEPDTQGGAPRLVWKTRENGVDVVYATEPARSSWRRLEMHMLSLLPLDGEL